MLCLSLDIQNNILSTHVHKLNRSENVHSEVYFWVFVLFLEHLLKQSSLWYENRSWILIVEGFPGGSEVKASARSAEDLGSIPGSGRSPGEGKWQSSPVFLPGESHGRRNLVGYSPRGRKESDTTERFHFHFTFLNQTRAGYKNVPTVNIILDVKTWIPYRWSFK